MTMDDVKALMKEAGWGALATTDGQAAWARPMGGWAWFGGELWCASAADTDKVAQIKAVPRAEYCFCTREGKHARLAGVCTISTDNDDKQKLYDAVPMLKNYIPEPTAPNYAVIRMKPDRVRVMASTDLQYTEVAPG